MSMRIFTATTATELKAKVDNFVRGRFDIIDTRYETGVHETGSAHRATVIIAR